MLDEAYVVYFQSDNSIFDKKKKNLLRVHTPDIKYLQN